MLGVCVTSPENFKSAASASFAIPAWGKYRTRNCLKRHSQGRRRHDAGFGVKKQLRIKVIASIETG
jgi:hypothetical protein